jgi:phage shock protein A
MNDLFKKLNTLINAKINSAVSDISEGARRKVSLGRSDKTMDRQIKKLRERIDKAIEYEDVLQQNVANLAEEVARLDTQADDAVRAGNDALARKLIADMQRAKQRLTMAESDLREHQLVAEDLIRQVNALEATVADTRRAEAQAAHSDREKAAATGEADSNIHKRTPLDSADDVMKTAQQKISDLADLLGEKKDRLSAYIQGDPVSPKAAVEEAIKESTIEDDLETRRQRLSKR